MLRQQGVTFTLVERRKLAPDTPRQLLQRFIAQRGQCAIAVRFAAKVQ